MEDQQLINDPDKVVFYKKEGVRLISELDTLFKLMLKHHDDLSKQNYEYELFLNQLANKSKELEDKEQEEKKDEIIIDKLLKLIE